MTTDKLTAEVRRIQSQLKKFLETSGEGWIEQVALTALEAIGLTTTIALDYQRLLEDLERLRAESEALYRIREAVVTLSETDLALGMDTFLEMILNTALRLTETYGDGFGSVLLKKDDARNVLGVRSNIGLPEERKKNEVRIESEGETPQGIVGWVALHGKSVLVHDVREDERYYEAYHKGTRSELTVPLLDGHRGVIGVLNLESPRIGAFDEGHRGLLEALAAHTVAAIRNLRLYQTVQKVSELIRTINSKLDLSEVLETFYDCVGKLTDAQNMVILSYDEYAQVLRLDEYQMRASDSARKIVAVPLGEGVSGRAAKERRLIYEPDVWKLDLDERKYIGWIDETRANLAVPLLVDERLIGVLNVESSVPKAFDSVPRDLLNIFASSAAIAINNTKLHQQLANHQAYTVLAGVIGKQFHDIVGNNIGGIRAVLQQMEDECDRELRSPRLRRLVDSIQVCADAALEESRRMAYQFRQPAKEVSVFEEHLEQAAEDCGLPTDDIPLIKEYDEETARLAVRGSLCTILGYLIQNSITAMDGRGTLTVCAERRNDRLYVQVMDTGCGIPKSEWGSIFDLGFTKKQDRGIGFGLWATKTMIGILGGEISVQSQPGETIFTFWLPLATKESVHRHSAVS